MWNEVEGLSKFARWTPYIFISLGFIVAVSGQFIKMKIDQRINVLNEQAEIALKNIPPELDVTLAKYEKTGELVLQVKASNNIPFISSWYVKTFNNEIVSGIQLEKPESYPTNDERTFLFNVSIAKNKIKNHQIELQYTYESIYSSELNNPSHLSSIIIKKYLYIDGNIYPLLDAIPSENAS
ncbi:hypothetical protein BCT41_07820 [Vibrio splendidus]|nr:hypothetical protein BCT41_07820 [Vibrio splendidus]